MAHKVPLLLLLQTLLLISCAQAKRSLSIVINNFTCVTLEHEYVNELSCMHYKAYPFPTIYVRFNMKKLVNNFDIVASLDIIKTNGNKVTLAQSKMDGCKYLNGYMKGNVMGRLFKRIQNAHNVPKSCPVQPNQVFEVRNFTLPADEYPPLLPAVKYQVRVKLQQAEKVVCIIFCDGALVNNY